MSSAELVKLRSGVEVDVRAIVQVTLKPRAEAVAAFAAVIRTN